MSLSETLQALRALDTADDLEALPTTTSEHIDPAVVRPAHVRSAFEERDAARVLRHGDTAMAVITKHVAAGAGFVWVLPLVRIERPASWRVADAFRLYGERDELARWAADPLEAFAVVLERYGLDFTPPGATRPVRFSPRVRVPAPTDRLDPLILASTLGLGDGVRFHVSQMMSVVGGEAHLAFAYFVDDDAYRRAARGTR